MRTVQEWRDEYDREGSLLRHPSMGLSFRKMLDDWINEGHASDFVKVTVIDSGETRFELAPR